ncbi:MAG: hypothetical protein KJO79_08035, partial [Verrucomicrobiae bacterium]|nr:hypothetical protein [Verrucomicrobiae bacterium]NNJ87114.1 hypothetical protein [Akkermansiaceae bacterium]
MNFPRFINQLTFFTMTMVFSVTAGMGARYIKPDESKEIFKLEKIPIQVAGMQEIARHLVIL